jgi:hypothetical protein
MKTINTKAALAHREKHPPTSPAPKGSQKKNGFGCCGVFRKLRNLVQDRLQRLQLTKKGSAEAPPVFSVTDLAAVSRPWV